MRPLLAQSVSDLDWCDALTDRQQQVVALVRRGLSNKKIAHELNVSEGTVKAHVHNILVKVGVRSRTELIVIAARLTA
jgi:DNA-binding NarL/FixJ family response regulator